MYIKINFILNIYHKNKYVDSESKSESESESESKSESESESKSEYKMKMNMLIKLYDLHLSTFKTPILKN